MINNSSALLEYREAEIKARVNFKKRIFIASFFLFTFIKLFVPFFISVGANSVGQTPLSAPSAALMFGVSLLVAMAMKRKIIFRNKAVTMFFTGTFLYMFYIWFISVTGLTLFAANRDTYMLLLGLSVFSVTLFFAARIVIAYDLKLEVVKAVCLSFGITLVTAYITHFDNFAFIGRLGDIFNKSDRYRFAFGLGHPNMAGRDAIIFLIYSIIYRALSEERENYSAKKDSFDLLFLRPSSAVAVFILLSSASRTSITSLILFFMVYYFNTFRSRLGVYMRVILAMSVVVIAYMIIVTVDWEYVFYASNRMGNYASLDTIFQKKAWLIGSGFIGVINLQAGLNFLGADGYYLIVYLRSGLIGFVLHIGTIFLFTKYYFQDLDKMTKFQRLAGGLLAVYLYYGIFESTLFGSGAINMASWILFFAAINEKKQHGKNT